VYFFVARAVAGIMRSDEMRVIWLLVTTLLVAMPWASAVEGVAKAEIDYLLRYVETADCRFVRGGTEYPPAEAAAHLRMKLGKAGNRIKTAEEFIEGVASKSYLSGTPYQIKLPDGTLQPAGPWLTKALERHRQKKL
jgi:hypothetical protein